MTAIERLEDRVAAVERAALDGDHDFDDLAELASVVERVERIEDRIGTLESRVADLEARAESVEGYVANVRSVTEGVEDDAAVAGRDSGTADDADRQAAAILEGTDRDGSSGSPDRQNTDDSTDPAESDLAGAVPDPPGEPLGVARAVASADRRGARGGSRPGTGVETVADGSGTVPAVADQAAVRDRYAEDADGESLLSSLASRFA